MKWSVAGHAHICNLLSQQITADTVSHAYLCVGPRSIGKRTVMRQFADELSPNQLMHLTIVKQDDANAITVDQVREIQQFLALKPATASWRIVFLHSAEKLNLEAANRLLKVLEEPPTRVVFILITEDAHAVLPTIRSRCQLLRFAPVLENEMREFFLQVKGVVPNKLADAYITAPGLPGRVLSLIENEDLFKDTQVELQRCKEFVTAASADGLAFMQDEILCLQPYTKRKEAYQAMLNLLLSWLHDILQQDTNELSIHDVQILYARIVSQYKQLAFNPDIKTLAYALPL